MRQDSVVGAIPKKFICVPYSTGALYCTGSLKPICGCCKASGMPSLFMTTPVTTIVSSCAASCTWDPCCAGADVPVQVDSSHGHRTWLGGKTVLRLWLVHDEMRTERKLITPKQRCEVDTTWTRKTQSRWSWSTQYVTVIVDSFWCVCVRDGLIQIVSTCSESVSQAYGLKETIRICES